ncbi:MAG: hypothetical protein QOH89_2220, partial [Pseudonocardiales bacterium]|nr:hypothetical protein [Pseudonocardiales bacterium]
AAGQRALYERVATKPRARSRVRPRRAVAVQQFGEPARIAGGGRPFALPVLRNDAAAARALASVVDVLSRRDAGPAPQRIKVVYLDHVARMSGGELALVRLIEALPTVEAHVILAEDGPLRPALEAAGATVEVLPLDPRARDLRRDEVASARLATARTAAVVGRYTLRLARRLRALEPDLVHANSLKSGYYGSAAARLARVPVVWHLRDRLADDYLPARAGRLTHALLRYLPDLVICNSAETLRTAGPKLRSGAIVGSPVVHDPYEPVAKRRTARRTNVIGIVGRIADWKGQDVFLRALAELRTEHPQLRGRIVGAAMFGEHDYERSLHELADELGLADAVEFTGYVDAVETELAGLDVLVHASVLPEPFGQVVVEGMAAGLPVVATSAGGPAEIITDGEDGLLVPPGDVEALTVALKRLLTDKQLRSRLGRAARLRAEDFAPEVIGAQVRGLYDELLARRPQR